MSKLKKITSARLFLPIVCLIAVLMANLITTPGFFKVSINNGVLYGYIVDVINRASELVILAIGMTLVTAASGGQDISVGAVMAVSAAVCAANGVDFLLPRKPSPPAEAQLSALPWVSVRVTMVLLKEERICAAPRSTTLRSRRLRTTFFSFCLGAIVNHSSFIWLPSSCRRWSSSGPCGYERSAWCSGRERADPCGDAHRDSSRSPSCA